MKNIIVSLLLAIPTAIFAQQGGIDAALVRALKQAELPLERGLAASSREGVPISAKYELENDDANELQLSVYTVRAGAIDIDFITGDVTVKDSAFFEVIVDHVSGKIAKVIPIKGGEDLAAAQNQSKAMAQARRSLETATVQALRANSGYRAVSAIPDFKDGHAVAKVVLVDGSGWKTVYEALD